MDTPEETPIRQWEEIDHRDIFYGVDLTLRRDAVKGHIAILAIDSEGAKELITDKEEEALEAFRHPSVTPGIDSATPESNLWDGAFDELNNLPKSEQRNALASFERFRNGQRVGPELLFHAVRHQKARRRNQLGRAA